MAANRPALHTFEAIFRGRLLKDAPPLATDQIRQVGLMIADRRDGPFRLEVASLKTLEAGDEKETNEADSSDSRH
ncbi:CIA30 family protein [Halomonas sp. BC04]|uniref:CIA30 family protein n=1 Tax=Halomonas sp. BC04 TaxID=1403540 RepID=UPI0003ED79AC|nr:CIA30 family protein [Halomonas sp. BC04]EWH03099.1 hypothetical protein Q427_05110 [Halomonas sp. BC04]